MRRTVTTAGTAALCAVLAGTTRGPVQLVVGLLLCLYLPGRLAVLALFHPNTRLDRVLRLVLTTSLSLAATMLVGLLLAGTGLGFKPATSAGAVLCVCLLFACGAVRHPADKHRTQRRALPPPRWSWLAAAPVLLLSALLVVQIHIAIHHRPAGSWYTQLALTTQTTLDATVVVNSRERSTLTFRLEERADGVVLYTTRFTLAPGHQQQFTVSRDGRARIEVRLYRDTDTTPYRYLIF